MTALQAILSIVLVTSFPTAISATADVKVQFYMLQLDEWTQRGMADKVRATLASGLTAFCSASLSTCGLSLITDRNFTSSDVHFSSGYPKNLNLRYLELAVYISYTLSNGSFVNLSAAHVASIVQSARTELYNQIGYHLVYIGSTFYSVPPPGLVNWIVVSIVTAVTVGLVVTALVLAHQHSAHELKGQIPIKEESAIPMQQQQQQQPRSEATTAATLTPSKDDKQPLMSSASSQRGACSSDNEGFEQSRSAIELRKQLGEAQDAAGDPAAANDEAGASSSGGDLEGPGESAAEKGASAPAATAAIKAAVGDEAAQNPKDSDNSGVRVEC